MLGSWVGALCPPVGHWFQEPCLCSGPVVMSMPRGRGLVILLALLWQWLRPTTPRTATKIVGHLSRKSNSGENNQSQDDSVTTDRRHLPTPEASCVDFGFRASAGLLFDTQSVRDHRRQGVQQPKASSVLGTAPELRRTSTTSDAAGEVRTQSPRPYARKSCSSRRYIRGSSVTPPTRKDLHCTSS